MVRMIHLPAGMDFKAFVLQEVQLMALNSIWGCAGILSAIAALEFHTVSAEDRSSHIACSAKSILIIEHAH